MDIGFTGSLPKEDSKQTERDPCRLGTGTAAQLGSNVVVNGGPLRTATEVRRFRPVRSTYSWVAPRLTRP